jgi:hypothetical protein
MGVAKDSAIRTIAADTFSTTILCPPVLNSENRNRQDTGHLLGMKIDV